MNYVEWLRVRGCLKWTALALGALFLVGAIIRLALIGHHDTVDWANGLISDPGSKVTHSVLADGAKETVIDNAAKQVHVVIDDRGARGKHIEVDDYSGGGSNSKDTDLMLRSGNINVSKLPQGRGTRIVVDTNENHGDTQFIGYVMVGIIVAFIVATVLGVPLARENDGHLEIALTKPASRDRFGAMVLLVDMAGILAALVSGMIFAIAMQSLFEIPNVAFSINDLFGLGVSIVAPLAWYAMLTAATASLKRGYGAVLGFAWPAAAIVLGLSLVQPNGNAVLTVVHGIAWVLSFINPLTYLSLHAGDFQIGGPDVYGIGYGGQILALAALTAFYVVVSLAQWRRVEA